MNKKEGLELVKKALKTVEISIRLREGNFLLQSMPTILGENAVNAIEEQLNQIKNKDNTDEGNSNFILFKIFKFKIHLKIIKKVF